VSGSGGLISDNAIPSSRRAIQPNIDKRFPKNIDLPAHLGLGEAQLLLVLEIRGVKQRLFHHHFLDIKSFGFSWRNLNNQNDDKNDLHL
jgi:hypothetical protein